MKMNTDIVKELITKYLLGKTTKEENARLISWLQESPDNLAYYQQIRNIWQASQPAFNPEFINTDKAHAAIMKKITRHKKYKTYFMYWQRIAAVLLLPLILLSVYLFFDKEKIYEEETFQEVFSPYGTHSKVNLPDGSTVWLNAGSSLKFPTAFIQGKRDVYLKGEGYFDVESDKENPFFVHMERLKVRATGTTFNIEAYKNDSLIAVTLVEGVVDVIIGDNKPFDLFPGERIGFNIYTARCEIIKTDPYKWYAWKDGVMVFRDDPLGYVFKRIGKTFNVNIEVKNPEIASFPYRATFKDEPLDEILRLLKLSAPIDYKKVERTMTEEGQYIKQTIEVEARKKK